MVMVGHDLTYKPDDTKIHVAHTMTELQSIAKAAKPVAAG
jgi:hypothetical protein